MSVNGDARAESIFARQAIGVHNDAAYEGGWEFFSVSAANLASFAEWR